MSILTIEFILGLRQVEFYQSARYNLMCFNSFLKECFMKTLLGVVVNVVTVVLAVVALAGCHTVQGLGQDISSGGQALSQGASQIHHDMSHH